MWGYYPELQLSAEDVVWAFEQQTGQQISPENVVYSSGNQVGDNQFRGHAEIYILQPQIPNIRKWTYN